MNNQTKKLVTVTRKDLTPAQQSVQSTHVALDFIIANPAIAENWHSSNYLICLAVSNETDLKRLIEKCSMKDLEFSIFREPDLNNEITAICIEPSEETQKLVSNLPLMLKQEKDIIVFHYNKKHNEDINIPPWIVKSKGETYYVHHLDVADGIKWSTKETPENEHTKAALKIRGKLTLVTENNQIIAKIN